MSSGRHCPYCNSTAVIGLGAFVDVVQTVVEMRCHQCGELFISNDRRNIATEATESLYSEN